MIFNLKRAKIYKAVQLEKEFLFGLDNKIAAFFKPLTFIFFILFVLGVFFQIDAKDKILGLSILSLSLWVFFETKKQFFNDKIKNPELKVDIAEAFNNPEAHNLAEFLDFDSAKIFLKTESFCRKQGFSQIEPPLFVKSLMEPYHPLVSFLFERLEFKEQIKEKLKEYSKSISRPEKEKTKSHITISRDFEKAIIEAGNSAIKKQKKRISAGDILFVSFKTSPFLAKILIDFDFKLSDIEDLVFLYEDSQRKIEKSKIFWEYYNLQKYRSVGKDWGAGYTYYLNQYSTDLTESVQKWILKEIIGHQKSIEQAERILSKKETNSVLIVGNPGTGRRSVVEALARKFYLGETHNVLKYSRVVELDLIALLAQTSTYEETEVLLNKVLQEASDAGNVILVIDDIHNFVGIKGEKPGAIDIIPILSKYLHLSNFKMIALTAFTNLHTNLEQHPAFLSLFEKVEITEISREDTLKILINSALELEKKYKILITYPALREIIHLTGRYFPAIPFPKKAIDVLDEVVVYASNLKGVKKILPEHVAKIISEKTEIPVGKMEQKEKEILLKLESFIHQRVINQEEAVKEISQALRRARAEIESSRKKPMGTFLFLGPTGVGKTETAKALSEVYFGQEDKMIRLDMSEFQRIENIPDLLGKPGQEGLLTTKVIEDPFSLVLLDEIEKAHPNILNLFLQVFDEGWITDGQGRRVIFTNTIIIGTSNAGAELIWEEVVQKKKNEIIKEDIVEFLVKNGIFKPEFINRFDAVVVFKPLTKENLLLIAELKLSKLQKGLKERGIELKISRELKEKITELSYKPEFGAREMNRVIQDKVENLLAEAILSDKLKKGDKAEIDSENFSLIIKENE